MPPLEPPQNFIFLFLFQIGSMNGNVTSSSHQTPTMDSLFEPFSKAKLWISKQKLYVQQKVCQDLYSVELPYELNPWWV
jgi:hypothetical protein